MLGLNLFTQVTWAFLLLRICTLKVHARECFRNGFGEIECTGLSTGARVGIGIAFVVAALLLIVAFAVWRRRRLRNRNLTYLQNPNATYPPQYGPSGQSYPPPPGYPQYPPQTYADRPSNEYTTPYTGYNPGYDKPQFSSEPSKK